MLSSILILDTAKLEEGPIAIVELPFRLRAGIHGTWVPAQEFGERKELCDIERVTEEMRREFEGANVKTEFLGEVGGAEAREGKEEKNGVGSGKW
jgi:Retinal pigment epithelial membrane protein